MAAQPPPQPTPEARAFSLLKEVIASDDLYNEFVPDLTDTGKARMEEAGLSPDGVTGVPEILTLVVREMENAPAAQRPPQPTPDARVLSLLKAALADGALFAELLTEPGKKRMEQDDMSPDSVTGVQEILSSFQFAIANTPEAIKAREKSLEDQQRASNEALDVFSALKTALSSNIRETTNAFVQTMWMYMISFYMGVALVLSAIVLGVLGKYGTVVPSLFGGLGTANIIAFFFTKPPERLQSSRASLAQMQCAMLSWYSDFYNDQVILIKKGNRLGSKEWETSAKEYLHRTDDWMKMLQRSVSQAADISTDNSKSAVTRKSKNSGKSTDNDKVKQAADSSDPQ